MSLIRIEPGATVLQELCDILGGKVRVRKLDEGETLVCRVNISSPQQSRQAFEKLADFIAEKYGFEKAGVGSKYSFMKSTGSGHLSGTIGVEEWQERNLKAIEIEYDGDFLEITPITRRGRGCTLFLNKYRMGAYCEKNGCTVSVEGFIY